MIVENDIDDISIISTVSSYHNTYCMCATSRWDQNDLMYCQGVYGKPGTQEQPGSAGTALFLRLESRANTIMPLMVKTLQQN